MEQYELYLAIKKWETIYNLGWLLITAALISLTYWRAHRNGYALRNTPLNAKREPVTVDEILAALGGNAPGKTPGKNPTITADMRAAHEKVSEVARVGRLNQRGAKTRGV